MGPKQGISFLDILRNIEGAIVDTEGKVQLSRSFKFASE
jgi:hypothetical protein